MELDFKTDGRRTWLENDEGEEVALLTHPQMVPRVVNFLHAEVDDSLKGQGIGSKLLEHVCGRLRKEGRKAVLSCTYCIKWFQKHPEYQDVLEDPKAEAAKALRLEAKEELQG